MSNDPMDTLIDYVNTVKPFHTKIYEVLLNYAYGEDMFVTMQDGHEIYVTVISPETDQRLIGGTGSNKPSKVICPDVGWDTGPFDWNDPTLPFGPRTWDYPTLCVQNSPSSVITGIADVLQLSIEMVDQDDVDAQLKQIPIWHDEGWDTTGWSMSGWQGYYSDPFTMTIGMLPKNGINLSKAGATPTDPAVSSITESLTIQVVAVPTLADGLALIYSTSAAAQAKMNSSTPPGFTSIFNSWNRTAGANYYPGGVGATGEAALWQLMTNPDRVVMPVNSGGTVGFSSPNTYSDFVFEATLFSSDSDDDVIGLILGLVPNGSTAKMLTLSLSGGGVSFANAPIAAASWDIGYAMYTTDTAGPVIPAATDGTVFATASTKLGSPPSRRNALTPPGPGWGGKYRRVRVKRSNDKYQAWWSDWSASRADAITSLNAATQHLDLDLSKWPLLADFMGNSPYGFMALSQSSTTFYDVNFSGVSPSTADPSYVYDVESGKVYHYTTDTGWQVQTGVSIIGSLGYIRTITNPETGTKYRIQPNSVKEL